MNKCNVLESFRNHHPQSVAVFLETSPCAKKVEKHCLRAPHSHFLGLPSDSQPQGKQTAESLLEFWRKCPRPGGPVFFLVLTLGINQLGDLGQRHFLRGEAGCSQTDLWFKS